MGPVFAFGALFGRLYGHIIYLLYNINIESVFAMAGSAGAFSGFSHTVSSALMIFEMTGQERFASLLLISALISNLVGQSLSMGIFDVLLAIKNIPHLPALKSTETYKLLAGDLMEKIDYALELKDMTIIKSFEVLNKIPKKKTVRIPVIDSYKTIKYTIAPHNMVEYIISEFDGCKSEYDPKTRTNISEFININIKKFFNKKRPILQRYKDKFKKIFLGDKEEQILKLNKTFKEESCMRILNILSKMSNDDDVFLGKSIDIHSNILNADPSSLTIDKGFPYLKIQYLFTFLNLTHIFVCERGKLCGVITKASFIAKK